MVDTNLVMLKPLQFRQRPFRRQIAVSHLQTLAHDAIENQRNKIAGLWEHWTRLESGETVESYTVITTTANDFMAPIHDRMPVILGRADWEAWLDPDTGNPLLLESMLQPCPDGWLECEAA